MESEAAPAELAKYLAAAIDAHKEAEKAATLWAKVNCPFRDGETVVYGGQKCLVFEVNARLFTYDVSDPVVIWYAKLIDDGGTVFTVSELSMPHPSDLQN